MGFQKEKDKAWEAKALHEVAETHAFNDNFQSALRAGKKALALVQDLEDKRNCAVVLSTLGIIKLSAFVAQAVDNSINKEKQPWAPPDVGADAMKSIDQAKALSDKVKDMKLIVSNLFAAAQVHIVMKRPDDAMTPITEAAEMCTKGAAKDKDLFFQEGQVIALVLTAYCDLLEGNDKKAAETADKALGIAKQIQDARGEWLANNVLEIVEKKGAGDGEEAEDALAVDPEMLKMKINDVANSLMGIESLAGDTPLMDAGLDSLSMVEFRNELVKEFPGVDLPGALLFDYPTVNSLTEFIQEGLTRAQKSLK